MPRLSDAKPRPRHIAPSVDGPTVDRIDLSIIHGRLYRCHREWSIAPMKVGYDGLFFIHRGHGWVEVNNQRLDVSPGMLVLTRQADILSAGHDPARPIRTYSIGFTLRTSDGDDLQSRRDWPLALRMTPAQARTWAGMMKLLTDDLQSGDTSRQTLAHGRLLLALDHVGRLVARVAAGRRISRAEPTRQPDPRIRELLKFIDDNLDQPLSTSLLAKKAHVSAAHLAYLFRNENLPAPMDLVRQRRVAMARTLLAGQEMKIAAIAHAVGYPDPFHFSRVFSRLQGRSPESYRASCKHPFDS